jgi:DNA sulfur modification protein DndE
MTVNLVEPALRTTYHLAGSDATRLRRLTRQSGLEAENVLSRLAIVTSLAAGPDGRHGNYLPSKAGRTKEIKGTVLLGRPRQAALLLALLARAHNEEFLDPKAAITWHWARGLRLLEDDSPGGDVLHALAEQLAKRPNPSVPNAARRARRAGLGGSVRDELAATVARRYPRWPTEVCRLVAMAARLDADQVDAVAARLAADAGANELNDAITESTALRVLQGKWGINRLGLTPADRDTLARLLKDEPIEATDVSVSLLQALGLVSVRGSKVTLTALGRRSGSEAIHP